MIKVGVDLWAILWGSSVMEEVKDETKSKRKKEKPESSRPKKSQLTMEAREEGER